MTTSGQMNKLAIIPIFFLTMCGTAPVTPPAGACSLPLDGSPANCPDERDLILIPRQELKGEVDIYNPDHWVQMQMMFQRNIRKDQQVVCYFQDHVNLIYHQWKKQLHK